MGYYFTSKEWLLRGWKVNKEIGALIEAQASLKAQAKRCTSTIGAVPGAKTQTPHGNERFIVSYLQLEEKINSKIDELVNIKMEILAAIESVNVSELRALLIYRYIDFKTWEEIAYKMNYSYHYVKKELHIKALKIINIPHYTPF
nr:MAG TPA: Protein of unknown function (DUF1492) [Caudoviricetes sp.]